MEATRAGEQSRGFAVAAAEVRARAQRSSQAAGDLRGESQRLASLVTRCKLPQGHTADAAATPPPSSVLRVPHHSRPPRLPCRKP